MLYVADHPRKGFVGIKPLGFRTLRVLTGQHLTVKVRVALKLSIAYSHSPSSSWSFWKQGSATVTGKK